MSVGRVPPALSTRLGKTARREHARRAIEIPIQSLDIAPRGAPAHARGSPIRGQRCSGLPTTSPA